MFGTILTDKHIRPATSRMTLWAMFCLGLLTPTCLLGQSKFEQGLARDRSALPTNFGTDWQANGWQGGSWLNGTGTRQQDWRLGVRVDNLETGVLIREVTPNSAGDRARLEVNDQILTVGGFQVGLIDGRLFDLGEELKRRADSAGIVSMLVQDHRSGRISNVRVQLDANSSTLTGTLVYRERMALPVDAVAVVQIENRTRPFAAVRGGQTSYRVSNTNTIPFEIAYDASYINPQDIYEVRAYVTSSGREVMTSQPQRVLTLGNPSQVRLDLIALQTNLTSTPASAVVSAGYPNYNVLNDQVVAIYRQYLNRPPSNAELAALRFGPDLTSRINTLPIELMASQEYFDAAGNNNQLWLERVFGVIVGKSPTQTEFDQWMRRYADLRYSRTELLRQLYSQVTR